MIGAVVVPLLLVGSSICDWKDPGHEPFMGDVPSAIESYSDIPRDVRATLRSRMERRAYDDMVVITRDSITSPNHVYGSEINSMHFGAKGKVCGVVTRESWNANMRERGLVYCESGYCIVVPTVCRNVARIERYAPEPVPPLPGVPDPLPPTENAPSGPPSEPATYLAEPSSPPPTFEHGAEPSNPWGANPDHWGFWPPQHGGGGGGGHYIPCVVTPVPEPAVWITLLAGLFLVRRITRV